jgi:hypothetical protein
VLRDENQSRLQIIGAVRVIPNGRLSEMAAADADRSEMEAELDYGMGAATERVARRSK